MPNDRNALERIRAANDTSVIQPEYARTIGYGEGYGEDDTHANFDLSKYMRWVRAVYKRKWLILIIAILGTIVFTIETYRTRDTYQASAVIEVGKESSSLAKSDWAIADDEDPVVRANLKTKMFLLESTPLLEDVIVELKLDRNQRFLSDLDLVRHVYKKKSLGEAFASLKQRLLSGDAADAEATNWSVVAPSKVKSDLAHERPEKESERLEPLVEVIRNNLRVEQIPDTRLLKVSFVHTDPNITATFSNYTVRRFIERNFESKIEKLSKASDWLDRTTQELKEKAEKAEEVLAGYTKDHNIFAAPSKGSLQVEKLTRLTGEITRAETDRIIRGSLFEQVKQGKIAQIPESFSDPKTAELHRKLAELIAKAAQFDVYYGPENPQTLEVQDQITAMQKQLAASHKMLEEKFKTDYERAVRDEQAFKAAFEVAKHEAVQENQDAIRYNILVQEVETAKLAYKDFLQKTSQTSFELAREQNNLRVVEAARVPKITVGPARKQWVVLGFALSLALGIGLALVLEFFDHTIRDVEDVSRHVQLPALAIIPSFSVGPPSKRWVRRKQKQLALHVTPSLNGSTDSVRPASADDSIALDGHSQAAEAYRLLRTSVTLAVPNGESKVILVTSSQPGEGKTTTTINTAISLAQLGASVLIIDCDLRTPTVHKVLGIDKELGLSSYLSGDDVELDGLIQKLQMPGLSVLPCGPVPHNPAELLGSRKMREMLETLVERYDHVLIDSPPLINLADAIVLSTLVDGVILVVHGGKSTRDAVRRARQDLSNVGANIFGVVLNNVNARHMGYSAYHQ